MANSYNSVLVSVSTTGSNVIVYQASEHSIVRSVLIHAKGTTPTVSVLYDDRTTDDVIAKKTLTADETWTPFTTALSVPSAHEIKVNTTDTINVLITYVEFS